jgi:hypothetical protein
MWSASFLRVVGGWLAGCGAVTVLFSAFVFLVLDRASPGDRMALLKVSVVGLGTTAPIIFISTVVLTALPAALVIWLSEKFRVRSILFFGCAGVAIGLLIHNVVLRALATNPRGVGWPFLVYGLAAGLVYWSIAGRDAGSEPG